jgi:predicted nucleic acid-binding protein
MPGRSPELGVVVTDANILINLLHVEMLAVLGKLTGFRFVIPEEVRLEVKEPTQAAALNDALAQNLLQVEPMQGLAELSVYVELRGRFGAGEAACLSIAQLRNWLIATDERGAFRHEVLRRLGDGKLLNTPGIIVLGIKAGVVSVEDADEAKRRLENKRFRMKFGSFRELLEE